MSSDKTVEILSPMTTFNNTDYDELAHIASKGGVVCCGIRYCGLGKNFSETNPEYTSSIFLNYYPEFANLLKNDNANTTYINLFNTFYEMANHDLDYNRFGYDWYYLMSAYIAHYITLSLMKIYAINNSSQPDDINSLIGALSNQSMGVAVKESLGGEEIETENMINVNLFRNAGNFMTTPYGREFWDKYYGYSRNFIRGVY